MWLRKLPHHSTQIKGISKWLHECWTPHCSVLTGRIRYIQMRSESTKKNPLQVPQNWPRARCHDWKNRKLHHNEAGRKKEATERNWASHRNLCSQDGWTSCFPRETYWSNRIIDRRGSNRVEVKTKNLELLAVTADLMTVSVTDDGHRSDFYGICNKNELKDLVVSLRGVTNDCVRRFKRSWRYNMLNSCI